MTIKQTAAKRKKLPFTTEVRQRWRKVRARILREPGKYDQGDYGYQNGTCNSAMCLAGWYAHYLSKADPLRFSPREAIARDYGNAWGRITTATGIAWPAPFAMEFQRASTPRDRAKVAAKRIDHLLRTGE